MNEQFCRCFLGRALLQLVTLLQVAQVKMLEGLADTWIPSSQPQSQIEFGSLQGNMRYCVNGPVINLGALAKHRCKEKPMFVLHKEGDGYA